MPPTANGHWRWRSPGRAASTSSPRWRESPPITGQLPTTGDVSGIRNNGDRRFFLPYPVSTQTVRSIQLSYDGDQGWNGRADPSWLADRTGVVWWELW